MQFEQEQLRRAPHQDCGQRGLQQHGLPKFPPGEDQTTRRRKCQGKDVRRISIRQQTAARRIGPVGQTTNEELRAAVLLKLGQGASLLSCDNRPESNGG